MYPRMVMPIVESVPGELQAVLGRGHEAVVRRERDHVVVLAHPRVQVASATRPRGSPYDDRPSKSGASTPVKEPVESKPEPDHAGRDRAPPPGLYYRPTPGPPTIPGRWLYGGLPRPAPPDSIVMRQLVAQQGEGGVIAMDRQGNFTMPFNSTGMFRGRVDAAGTVTVGIFRDDEP